jgi:ParB/RepB/Spo0J family partition protein
MTVSDPVHRSDAPTLEQLLVTELQPCPHNPRRIDDDHPSLAGLAESIKAQGVLEPILVRQGVVGESFEILAGERRWRAARIAGLERVPCLVRVCDDATAFEITVTENLQREQLHWLEEARGVSSMIERGWDAEAIAGHIGKSPTWVHLRTKLATLHPKWLKAAADPKHPLSTWPVVMLEQIARFPRETQGEMIEGEGRHRILHCDSAEELRRTLEADYLHLLKAAPFPTDEGQLVAKAGACTVCPKRSSCQQALFDDKGGDRCLDAKCWDAKASAHRKATLIALKRESPKAVLAAVDYQSNTSGALGRYDFEVVKAGAKGAKEAILLEEGKAPRLGHIVVGSSPGARAAQTKAAPGPKPPKQRLAEFMLRRRRAEISGMLVKLGAPGDATSINHWGQPKATTADVVRPTRQQLIALAAVHGIRSSADGSWGAGSMKSSSWAAVGKLAEASVIDVDEELWLKVRRTLISQLIADKVFHADSGGAQFMAKICGVDWSAICAEVRDRHMLPKSLAAHFDEHGLPLGKQLAPKKPAKAKAKAAAANR